MTYKISAAIIRWRFFVFLARFDPITSFSYPSHIPLGEAPNASHNCKAAVGAENLSFGDLDSNPDRLVID
tara:strand:- start:9929 stop:10138 length:210 start_codon:yes stop_codon:yes gene_type:complete